MAALASLVVLWRRHFERLEANWLTILYFVLAFNGALYTDLKAGNVSLFEQLGLWLAFAALLKGQYARFCLCVILVAQFKLTPLFFAVLLLFVPLRPQWKWLALCVAGFGAVFSLNYLLQPELLGQFFKSASGLDEGNASTLSLMRDVLDRARGAGFAARSHLDELAFLGLAGVTALYSLAVAVRYRALAARDPKLLIYFACALFTVISPRMKVYSYILLLIPALHLLRRLPARTVLPAASLLAVAVLFPQSGTLLLGATPFDILYHFLPLAAAFLVWAGYLAIFRAAIRDSQSEQATQPARELAPAA
jgi:hypothetical protein